MSECPSGYYGPERRLPSDKCQYSEESAKKAVRDVFAILGVDVNRPEQIREFQDSLRFGDRLRKTADKGMIAFLVSVMSLLGTALFLGLKIKFMGE